jgi:glycosyltransferase involved in cell wall biosynthesis
MTNVLIVTGDHIGQAMAGPAIRCWEMSRVLTGAGHSVQLAASGPSDREPDGFEVFASSTDAMDKAIDRADVIIVQGLVMFHQPAIRESGKLLVADLYDPFVLEILELFAHHPMSERLSQHGWHLETLNDQLRRCDFFMCASDTQRSFWIGMLSALDRVNPHTHKEDSLLGRLIDIVPFGIATAEPRASGEPAARGVIPGIDEDSLIALWAGGIWNWFDPLSLIRAWPGVLREVPKARLLFMGTRHPNPDFPEMEMAAKARRLATELGLTGRGVHFNEGWVPYDRRQDYLLEADIGVTTHFNHLETAFSFRTRILDYIWAGLPVLSTQGDDFARWISDHGAGQVVGYHDPASITLATVRLLADESMRRACAEAVRAARPDFSWEHALEPLVRYCDAPWRAPDLAAAAVRARSDALRPGPAPLWRRLNDYRRQEGWKAFSKRIVSGVRRRVRLAIAGR